MDISKLKKVGTREEVYKNLAIRTAGNLKKDDIIEKVFGNKTMYISKKLSDKMKENIQILRTHNPNFMKKMQKKTMVVSTQPSTSTTPSTTTPQPNNTSPQASQSLQASQSSNIRKVKGNESIIKNHSNNHAKTHKLSFKVKENAIRTVFYPELKGVDLKELKNELLREEAEEDLGIQIPKTSSSGSKEFTIEEMPDINMADFE